MGNHLLEAHPTSSIYNSKKSGEIAYGVDAANTCSPDIGHAEMVTQYAQWEILHRIGRYAEALAKDLPGSINLTSLLKEVEGLL